MDLVPAVRRVLDPGPDDFDSRALLRDRDARSFDRVSRKFYRVLAANVTHWETRRSAAKRKGRDNMRMRLLLAAVAVVISGVGASVARADQPPLELAGQPFYFSATCTGI